ncbi:hypothetical protein F66182_12163 [Fusarium sp. NRRL 66182]|nr:hypothetical protein F66182_12163 [Fusarium sp. NRRL 66182]
MAEDLAAARKEKQDLFNEWRKLNSDPAAEAEAEDTAPPADFMKQIVPQLEGALAAAANVSIILDTTTEEFDQLGFSGATLYDRLADMRESFKLAWKELERCLPEEGLPSHSNGKEILTALKGHLQQVSISLTNEYQRFKELSGRYKAMREEYYHMSSLLADEEDKVKKLEESRALDANDMIHVRSRLQSLEEELEEKETAIARFSQNLKLVEGERDRYQKICGQVEEEHRTSEQRIAELNEAVTKITNIADNGAKKMEEFKKLLVDKQEEVTTLSKKVDQLIEENSKLLDRYTKGEQEIGRLNTHYAGVSTELQSTQADLQQTQLINDMLETQNQAHIEARNRIENFLNTAMKEVAKTFDVERERDRQHAVTKDILTGNGARHMQAEPEPSLPSNSPIKATLFGSNVRVGRGSDRSALSSGLGLDSGIGESETAQPQTDAPGSDVFLNAINEEEDENIE